MLTFSLVLGNLLLEFFVDPNASDRRLRAQFHVGFLLLRLLGETTMKLNHEVVSMFCDIF